MLTTGMTESFKFTRVDADRILRRAAEIEGSEDSKPVTIDELRSIAGEAGFGRQSIERAIAELRHSGTDDVRVHHVQRSGILISYLSTVRAIPFEISSEQLMHAVRLFQPYREGPAQVKLEEHQITWRDRKGLSFTLVSGGGVTELRVLASKVLFRRGKWMGWVKAAADRLEALVLLVAQQGLSDRSEVAGQLSE